MIEFSEYVSLGHPDKVADYISQYLLDRYIERDPNTRYAVEVQIKGHRAVLGGEVSSAVKFTPREINNFVCEAVNEIGYTRAYQDKWGAENTICGDDINVQEYISQQSPDIAQGLDGWGDQGIFFGMATPDRMTYGMPYDHTLAKELCKGLFESGLGGLDIKTQIVTNDGFPVKIIVAIPLDPDRGTITPEQVEKYVRCRVSSPKPYEVIVNGTGRYVKHGTIADCGTTGRKLAVDFYGGNCHIGGGSPWTKDGSKADLALNLVARRLAKNYTEKLGETTYTRLACCIGKRDVDFCVTDSAGNVVAKGVMPLNPAEVIRELKLDTPCYASMCRWGLFGEFQKDKPWE